MALPATLTLKALTSPLKPALLADGRKMYKVAYKRGQLATWSLFFHPSDDDALASQAARKWCKEHDFRFISVEPAVVSLDDV